jgi:hypothetical protein
VWSVFSGLTAREVDSPPLYFNKARGFFVIDSLYRVYGDRVREQHNAAKPTYIHLSYYIALVIPLKCHCKFVLKLILKALCDPLQKYFDL